MGGCASKPKESDILDKAPVNPEKPQVETAAQDNTSGAESRIEKPLVDLPEPEKEAQGLSSEPEAVKISETGKPTEDDVVKAPANNAEGKVEGTDNTTVPPIMEAEVKSDASLVSQ